MLSEAKKPRAGTWLLRFTQHDTPPVSALLRQTTTYSTSN